MLFFKKIVIFLFVTFLKLFTRTKVSYGSKIPPNLFFQLIRNRGWKLSLGKAIFGKGVKLSNGNRFYYNPEIFGKVEIGRNTSISGPSTRICAKTNHVKIGAFCSIASNVIIQEYYHSMNTATTYNILSNVIGELEGNKYVSKGDIIIEDDVWIGSNAVILSGVKIGRGAIVGAGAVVTKNVDKYKVVAGNPAKVIKSRFKESTILELEESKWWEWTTEKIIDEKNFFLKNRI